MRGGLRIGCGLPKGAKTVRKKEYAKQAALTARAPLEVMLEAMRCYQEEGNLERAAAVAKDAAPYMHPRLHAVAGSDGVPVVPVDEQSLATIARKVALAFRIVSQGAESGLIEDAGDSLSGEARQRLTTSTIGGAVASGRVFHESPTPRG